MKDGPCGYCRGVRLVGWSGAGPILCPRCCEHNEDVFAVVTQAWREQRTRVVELEAEIAALRESNAALQAQLAAEGQAALAIAAACLDTGLVPQGASGTVDAVRAVCGHVVGLQAAVEAARVAVGNLPPYPHTQLRCSPSEGCHCTSDASNTARTEARRALGLEVENG